ncbi:MAG: tripartite tricarboxylate transporter substrate binding protein [Pseudomonadota bacterium]
MNNRQPPTTWGIRRKRFWKLGPPGAAAMLWCLGLLGLPTAPALAQPAYPSMPIRFIIPTPSGGTHDLIARLIAQKLSANLKQPVIVESKPGATGMLAASYVAKVPPDGYTVLFGQASVVQNTVLRLRTPYQLRELAPVSLVVLFPVVVAVRSDSAVKSVADLVALSKTQDVSVASWGTGSTGHIIIEAINQQSGAKLTHIPYKGEADPFSDLAGGLVTAATGSAGFYLSRGDKTRILAVASGKRLKRLPNVPTLEEAGYPLANLSGWGGFFLPAGTPRAIVQKLSREIQKIVAEPDIADRIRDLDFEPLGTSSEEFAQFITRDAAKWTDVVKSRNLSLE